MIRDHGSRTIPVRLERSMLFVPAANWPMIVKATASAADAICIDLEDSVAVSEKSSSRVNVIRAFRELDFGGRLRMFRMNALTSPFAYRDLIDVVEGAGEAIDLVMLPKTDSPEDLRFVDILLTQIEEYVSLRRRIGIEAQIETASGFLALREIGAASPRLEALIFGPGDYAASLQIPSGTIGVSDHHDASYPGHRWHAVMHMIVAVARANGLRCLDGPYAAYKDSAGWETACRVALAMGFDGKQCIHPGQLQTANTIFSPSREEAAYAEQVVSAYEFSVVEKCGVTRLDGRMIDAASVRMAQTILQKRKLIQGAK